ncbi:MAG: xylann 1,4-beta-xylosidase [Lachnospiraceae bacterium]
MIHFSQEGKTLVHTWSACVGAGRANEGLRADWQAQLKTAVEECGFRYLRFHGLLHDDMQVYTIVNGEPHYNFQYIDKLFDTMLDTGIRPIVEFGFMPLPLISGDGTQFWWKGNVAPPKDYAQWGRLIDKLMNHWIDRYGIDEVREWYFEVWNEPNLRPFWNGTKSQYFELYKTTVQVIKAIDETLRVGGPATSNFVPDARFDGEEEDTKEHITFKVDDLNSLEWHGVWIEDFLAYCEKEQLPVDFVSCHPYPTDFALDGHGECNGRTRHRDSLHDDIMWLKGVIAKSAYPDAEIHLTEWSSSPSSRDYSHDYLPAAAYVMRSNLNCGGLMDSLSYWVFTDVFEEVGAGPKVFHGGFGLINLQGVKKPTFHAYRMLHDLGDVELERGEGYIFTKKNDKLQAAFYHYPDDYTDTVPMSMYPNQVVAQECQNYEAERRFQFDIDGLNPGDTYTLELLKKDHVPVVRWNEMGAPTECSREEERELIALGNSLEEQTFVVDADGCLHIDFVAEAWNIAELRCKFGHVFSNDVIL